MKILYLKLENFAMIKSAMKRKSIEIDFTKCKNRVVLLIGDNGTGKTTILSHLHPFANTGTGDIRNGSDQILRDNEGKHLDGYKEIHIKHGDNIYIIKHFYLYKSNKGIKSFISKNGDELNVNGNVTSFLECVEMELDVVPNYLKLLRLGSNVKNFFEMKATERKSYVGELLSDIDIYSKYYKKINSDSRVLKALLKTVSNRINNLKIYNEKDEITKKNNLENVLNQKRDDKSELNEQIGSISASINLLLEPYITIESYIDYVKGLKYRHTDIYNNINSLNNKINKLNIIIIGDYDEEIERLNSQLLKYRNEFNVNKGVADFHLKQLNSLYENKMELEKDMKYTLSDMEILKVEDHLLKLKKRKIELDKKFKNKTFKCTKDDILQSMVLMQEIDDCMREVNEFDNLAIKDVVKYINDKRNVESIAIKEITKIDNKLSYLYSKINNMQISNKINKNKVRIMFQPIECNIKCPFMDFYKEVMDNESTDTETIQTEIDKLNNQRDYISSLPSIENKINYIFFLINKNKSLIDRLPEDFFNRKYIMDNIYRGTLIYHESKFMGYLEILEDYEEYLGLSKTIKEAQLEKSLIEKTKGNGENIRNEIIKLDQEIITIEGEISNLNNNNNELNKNIDLLTYQIDEMKTYKELTNKITTLKDELNDLDTCIKDSQDKLLRINDLRKNMEIVRNKLNIIDKEIKEIETEMTNIQIKLVEFDKLNKEKDIIINKFDEIDIIKRSLSSSEGIPLLFIQLYFKNTQLIINKLLESVFGNDLEIDRFDINDKEFKIPYIKNGIRVDDISKCSQGEETFINMSFSFALIKQSIGEYNIPLFDEVDGALDYNKREKFLSILEYLMDMINVEQVFLITHNNVFDSYPVDVIMTSEKEIDNYKNTNIIFKITQ